MTYKSSSTFYRLGYSVTWNVVNSPLHFSKSVRLNIVLNTFLKGFLKYFRIKLVKWVGNMEGNYFKLSLIIFDKTYPKYYKFRGRLKPMKFFLWNYSYFKKSSWLLGQLRDYYTKRRFKPKFKLGSGNYWHKFYTSIYFILSKNFKHTRKTFKNGTIDAEFMGGTRSNSSSILKLNNVLNFKINKYSRLPQYQFMFKFYFKLYLYLNKWKLDNSLNFQEKKFRFSFLLKLLLLNLFLKKNIAIIRNKPLRRFQSRFVNSVRTKYTLTRRIISHRLYYFNYLNYVKGANYQWKSSGRVINNPNLSRRFNNKIPWSSVFLRGYFFNISYKKILRRNWLAATSLQNFLERIRAYNFLVKNYIVWKKNNNTNNLYISRKNLFFNNKFITNSMKRLKKYYAGLPAIKKKNNNWKTKKILKILSLKSIKHKLLLKNILFSNHYFFNEKENLYMNKYGYFKKSVTNGIIFYIRRHFKKSVFSHPFKKKYNSVLVNNNEKLIFFKNYYSKLSALYKNNDETFKKNQIFFKNDTLVYKYQNLSSFQKRSFIGVHNNPFDYLFNNFLFFFLFPKYSSLAKKKIKKKVDINNYLSVKFLFNEKVKFYSNNKAKNVKLLVFLKFYGELFILSNILKKKIYMYKNELNIFLFRSFWSLEFFKIFYNFKFRRLNFEKLFKMSRNNVASSNRKKIQTTVKNKNNNILNKLITFKKQVKREKNVLNFFFKNGLRTKYFFFHCILLRISNINKNIKKIVNRRTKMVNNKNVLKDIIEGVEKDKKLNKLKKVSNKNSIKAFYKKKFLLIYKKDNYKKKRLKAKERFFKYKIKTLLKKNHNSALKKMFIFYKKKNEYLKIWKKQFTIYYSYKNKKLLYHKKFKHNYAILIKNIKSITFFNKTFSSYLLLVNYIQFINNVFKQPYNWKKRIILKFVFYKRIFFFNYFYFLFSSFFKLPNFFLKKIHLLGFYILKKNINLFFFVKQINVILKNLYNNQVFADNRTLNVNRIELLKKKLFKKQAIFKKNFIKRAAKNKKSLIYIESSERYTRAQVRNNQEVNLFLKNKYDDLKNYKLRKLSFKQRFNFIKSLNLKKKGKYKKNFKAKSRNKYFGRVNYRKYKKFQNLELRGENKKKNWLSKNKIINKKMYVYFMLQKNLSKGILKEHPKLISKKLYNAGVWFNQNRNSSILSDTSQVRPKALLFFFNSFVNKLFKKKFSKNFKTIHKDEIRNFLFYLDRFKKKKFSFVPWRISKKIYFSNFYLSNIAAYRFSKLFYNKKTSMVTRSVVTHYPLIGEEHSLLEQYQFRYLKHLEKTMAITNRVFNKHRISWTKDFFSYKNHFEIFRLIQKKIYYNIKLNQRIKIKKLKVVVTNMLKKNKFNLFAESFILKFKNLNEKKKQKLILYYFKRLNYQLKEFILIKTKNNKLNFLLQYFLKLNYFTPIINLKFIKNTLFLKTYNSSSLVCDSSDQNKIFNFNKYFFKNKNLNKTYYAWLKIFLWRFDSFKKNNILKPLDDLEILNSQISASNETRKNKPWNVLFFGKFLKFFREKIDFNKYLDLYDKSILLKYEELFNLSKFFQSFLFYFFLQNNNTKKLLQINSNLKYIYKMKILILCNNQKTIRFFKNNLNLFYQDDLNNSTKFYIYTYSFINFLIFKIHKIKNNYYYRKKMYSTRFWIKNRKFLFWMEQQFEKSFKMNVKLNYISATRAISKFCRNGSDYYFLFTKRIHLHRFFQGWRQQSIFADILWIVIISIKYYSAIFLSNMLSEQLVKRKKQWPFIKIMRTVVKEVLPKNLMNDPKKIDGLRILINGKINGRDRSTSYLIYKFYKDKQISKIHQIYLKVDYSLSFANSKYGVFGIRVWISRL